jgi:NAD+ kinase
MKIGIYANLTKDKNLVITKTLVEIINRSGATCLLEQSLKESLSGNGFYNGDKSFVSRGKLIEDSDIIAVIGGDGTILGITAVAAAAKKPVLGVNLGKIGFLSECEVSEIESTVSDILAGRYSIEDRTMLDVIYKNETFTALNEVAISRAVESRQMLLDVYANGSHVDAYSADGFIVSTPTGSTAYSLSAGGPILSPNIQGFVLIPICSHSLHNKPIVIDDSEKILIKNRGRKQKAAIVVDGRICKSIDAFDGLAIQKSAVTAKFVRVGNKNFYSKLFKKLTAWSNNSEENEN